MNNYKIPVAFTSKHLFFTHLWSAGWELADLRLGLPEYLCFTLWIQLALVCSTCLILASRWKTQHHPGRNFTHGKRNMPQSIANQTSTRQTPVFITSTIIPWTKVSHMAKPKVKVQESNPLVYFSCKKHWNITWQRAWTQRRVKNWSQKINVLHYCIGFLKKFNVIMYAKDFRQSKHLIIICFILLHTF